MEKIDTHRLIKVLRKTLRGILGVRKGMTDEEVEILSSRFFFTKEELESTENKKTNED